MAIIADSSTGTPRARRRRTSTTGASRPSTNYGNAGMFDTSITNAYRRAGASSGQNFEYTRTGQDAWLEAMGQIATGNYNYAPAQQTTSSGSSGGSYGGGGGGGGGSSALTQAMIDAMAKALGAAPPQYTYTPVDLPDFQGQNVPAFNAAPYATATNQINAAKVADLANIAANQQATTTQLQNTYTNPYASAQVAQAPQAQTVGAGLMGSVGGTASPDAANQVNAAGGSDQAAFQNLYNVLAAADQQSQNSRMSQVGMDANYGRQNIDAQTLGLLGGVNMAQAQAQQTWAQQDAERRYQNSLLQQQYAREEAQANATGAQTAAQTNYQTNTSAWQSRLQPILDLISQSAGTSGLNFNALFQALGITG